MPIIPLFWIIVNVKKRQKKKILKKQQNKLFFSAKYKA